MELQALIDNGQAIGSSTYLRYDGIGSKGVARGGRATVFDTTPHLWRTRSLLPPHRKQPRLPFIGGGAFKKF